MRQNGIAVHESSFRPFERPASSGTNMMVETERTRALLSISGAMARMPGRKANLERLRLVANDRNASLEQLREISARLKVAVTATGTGSQTRSMQFPTQIRSGHGDRNITFLASVEREDRHGTIVSISGLDVTNYLKNPVFLLHHDWGGGWLGGTPDLNNCIGKTTQLRKTAKGLELDVQFLTADVNPRAEQALQMVRQGVLGATSISFIPKEVVVNIEGDREIPTITKSELLECSLVFLPSNTGVGVLSGRGAAARV